jgi:hypothetical protein
LLTLYKEFVLHLGRGVQLSLKAVIEAKYRTGIEIIGVPLPAKSYRPRMPQIGFARGTSLEELINAQTPFPQMPLTQPVLLSFKNGAPEKVSEEQLTYKSAANIYDYLRFDAGPDEQYPTLEDGGGMSIFGKFKEYVSQTNYAWWLVIRSWLKEHIAEQQALRSFKKALPKRFHTGLHVYVPVLCMNSPIWMLTGDDFVKAPAILCRVRPPNWPGVLRHRLLGYTLEAPLLITNPQGLGHVLTMTHAWFVGTERVLKSIDPALLIRWPVESALFHAVLAEFLPREPHANQLDEFDIMGQL